MKKRLNGGGGSYLVLLSKSIPDWSKRFAMSAPWCIEFDKDVLGAVHDNLVKVLSNNNLDGSVGVVWEVFRLQVSLNRSIKNAVNKRGDLVSGKTGGGWSVLGHVLLHVDDSHRWAVLVGDTEKFHHSLVVFNVAIDEDEKELALVALGGLGVSGHDLVVVGTGLGGEEEIVLFKVAAEDFWGGFVGEFVDESKLLGLDECDEGLFVGTFEVGAFIIELESGVLQVI